jgi:lipoprotein-releasing system ATP-binding protein
MNGIRVELKGLSKSYEKGGSTIRVLENVDLLIAAGDQVAIIGPSGIGKSTFLHLLGNLDKPSSGALTINGIDLMSLSDEERARRRNRDIGFVFQAHNLLAEHTALDNVSIPVRLAGASEQVARARASALLVAVGLEDRLLHQPGEMSGGEQQRVALARALVMGPGLVLADEPTGNLDPTTESGVFNLMLSLNEQLGSTLVVVTHSRELARRMPRQLLMENGTFKDITGQC